MPTNIEFIEADIATLDPDTLPEVDVASAHGLWSWVSDEVRAGIVRLLGRRLRPGGALHLSYNALPGGRLRQMLRSYSARWRVSIPTTPPALMSLCRTMWPVSMRP